MTQPENPMPMRPYRLVFSTLDRDGNEVRLTESQWEGHILREHSEMEPYLEEIKAVIEDPQLIAVGKSSEVYFLTLGAISRWPRHYLRVVATYSNEVTGRRIDSVRTAFLIGRDPKEVIYEREPSRE